MPINNAYPNLMQPTVFLVEKTVDICIVTLSLGDSGRIKAWDHQY